MGFSPKKKRAQFAAPDAQDDYVETTSVAAAKSLAGIYALEGADLEDSITQYRKGNQTVYRIK